MSKVATTRIEKQYKDKKTGEWKSLTINYAKVVDRLHEFREANPRGKISTIHKVDDNGHTIFKAYIWKDKADFMESLKITDSQTALLSADSEASARSDKEGEKDFEKLETIAIGRALAILGYAVNGEVASSEEMEAFEAYKIKNVEDTVEAINKCKTTDELRTYFLSIGTLSANKDVFAAKEAKKKELSA